MPLFLNHVLHRKKGGWFDCLVAKAIACFGFTQHAFLRGRDRRGCESAAPQEISETAIGS